MNITMQLAVVAAVCLCLAEGGPEVRVVRAKQQRPTRGFKNVEMMTARGFGKRDRPATRAEHTYEAGARKVFNPKSSLMVASDFGKRDGNDVTDEDMEVRQIRHKFNPGYRVLIARGYGKRDEAPTGDFSTNVARPNFKPSPNVLIARAYGKRDESENGVYGLDNFWEMLDASSDREGQDGNDEKTIESIPLDWFVNEMLNNPDFTRSVVRKFVDINQDGQLTPDELLRNVV